MRSTILPALFLALLAGVLVAQTPPAPVPVPAVPPKATPAPMPVPVPVKPAPPAPVAPAPQPAPAKIAVYPPDINLETSRDRQSFIVQATYADGLTRDVTEQAVVAVANPAFAKLEKTTCLPVADGVTELSVAFAGLTVKVPVKVAKAKEDRAISFKLDVMPVFLRSGCNSGGCHGAARGKDGFRLSLFGFDADGDHYRLTRELNGRRVNLAMPHESLLLEKIAGKVPHTGGKKISEGDEYYNAITRWLEADCPQDAPTVATVTGVEPAPPNASSSARSIRTAPTAT